MMWYLPWFRLVIVATLALLAAKTIAVADTDDWPCIQRKVPEISLAAVWTGPQLNEAALRWRTDPDVAGLVQRLAARRTSEEDARKAIADLAASSGGAKGPKLLALIAGLVETINAERGEVIAGLERFGSGQKRLATALRDENAKLSAMRDDAQADPAKLIQLNERLLWNLRIFDERQKSLSFVCEVPVLIEQRLFSLARTIQSALQQP
jgi:hypothetical protein